MAVASQLWRCFFSITQRPFPVSQSDIQEAFLPRSAHLNVLFVNIGGFEAAAAQSLKWALVEMIWCRSEKNGMNATATADLLLPRVVVCDKPG